MVRTSRFGRWFLVIAVAAAAAAAGGCPKNLEHSNVPPTCEPAKLAAGSPGSWDNPVRCEMPAGERAYLERLRGPDGKPVRYQRTGNLGQGVNGNIVDRYIVQSEDGSVCIEVIMDMYYPGHVEKQAVAGFTLIGRVY